MKYNPENERVKKQYEEALLHGRHRAPETVDAAWKAINLFENFTDKESFKTFNTEQAKDFKRWLTKQENQKGQLLSLSTVRSTLANIRDFFSWLIIHPKYIRQVDGRAVEYLRLSDNQERAGRATREKIAPTVDDVRKVLEIMPHESNVEKRNRAIIAFILITGIRDGALISLKHKDVDHEKQELWQDPKHVKTKNRKGITSQFIPIDTLALQIVLDWITYSKGVLKMGTEAALFPKNKTTTNPETMQFDTGTLSHEHWANAAPIRKIFHDAFKAAGLQKCHPHTLRNTITIWALENCDQLQFKAISQSMGHDHAMTTYNSYGTLTHDRIRKAVASIGKDSPKLSKDLLEELLEKLSDRN